MRSDGGLGGFGGGLERKTFLLKLENDSFGSNAHIG
jgi:O6-methylguanine-DNA--protein-cysteine methyltransferase